MVFETKLKSINGFNITFDTMTQTQLTFIKQNVMVNVGKISNFLEC